MNNKTLAGIIGLLLILGIGYWFYQTKSGSTSVDTGSNTATSSRVAQQDDVAKANPEQLKAQIAEQMKKIPLTIKVVESYKKCLSAANTKEGAVKCNKDATKYAKQLGIDDGKERADQDYKEFGEWTKDDKEKALGALDKGVEFLKQMMTQVKAAQPQTANSQ